ncbi:MAG: MmgE/PrpD family protein [Acidimicrobiales bacterium]
MGRETSTGTEALVKYAASLELGAVPVPVVERAKYLMLDGFACGLFAARLPWSDRAVQTMGRVDRGDGSRIWGRPERSSPLGAALLNGTFVQGFELDDYHERGPLHSESCVLPALMAAAEILGDEGRPVSGRELLLASLLGFEIGPRLGMALDGLDLIARGWHCGPITGVVSAGVAVGRLLGLDPEWMGHAIGMSATQASGLMSAQFGAMVKRMHSGFAARNALWASLLAAGGFTGIEDVLDLSYGGLGSCFSPAAWTGDQVLHELGERWELLSIAVKPYACMGGLHTTADAIAAILSTTGADGSTARRVRIGLPTAMFRHGGWQLERPIAATAAQMNVAYVAAVSLLDGAAFVDQFSPDRLAAGDVWEMVERVEIHQEEDLDHLGKDGRWACRVVCEFADGTRGTAEVVHPSGSASRPLSNDEIAAKAAGLMGRVWPPSAVTELTDLVLRLDELDTIDRLAEVLGQPATSPW